MRKILGRNKQTRDDEINLSQSLGLINITAEPASEMKSNIKERVTAIRTMNVNILMRIRLGHAHRRRKKITLGLVHDSRVYFATALQLPLRPKGSCNKTRSFHI